MAENKETELYIKIKVFVKHYLEHVESNFENPARYLLPKGRHFLADYPKNSTKVKFPKNSVPQGDHLVLKNVVLTTLPVKFATEAKNVVA